MKKSKTDITKYIFILFVIVLAIVTYVVYQKSTSTQEDTNQTKIEESQNIVKEIRLGIAEFDSINPILSKNKNVQQISKLIFDSLITFDENYNFSYALASEISKTSNKEYIIKIKENILWHNGDTLTAEDVKFTIETLQQVSSIYTENIKKVSSIEVIDAQTLKIILKSDTPFFEYNLTFPIMSKKYYEGENFKTSKKNLTSPGTGMYRIDSTAENVIKLTKNTNYWNKEKKNAIIEKVNINLYDNMGDVYNAFKNGNIDLVDTTLSSVKEYIGTLGYTAATYSTREFDYLVFNCSKGCLSDKAARKAIGYAIDRTSIIKKYYGSNYSVSTFPLDFGSWVYTKNSVDSTYDTQEAQRILKRGGWDYTNGSWYKKGVKLAFTITVNTENTLDIRVAENIKNQLGKLKIDVNVKRVSKKNYYNYISKKTGYEAMIININTSYSPNINTYIGSGNTSKYSNSEVSELLKQIYATGDASKIKEAYTRLIEIYNEDVPFIGLARKNGIVVYNTNLVGTTRPTAFNIFSKFQNWYRKNY